MIIFLQTVMVTPKMGIYTTTIRNQLQYVLSRRFQECLLTHRGLIMKNSPVYFKLKQRTWYSLAEGLRNKFLQNN